MTMNFVRHFRVVGLWVVLLAAGGRSAQAQAATSQTTLPPVTPINQISIAAKVPTAYAAAGVPGIFVISRSSGNLLEDVTVSYQVSGGAAAGREYQVLKGTKTIPQGETKAQIKVHPLVVAGSGGTAKNVKVTLLAGEGYALTAATQAKVKIVQ